MRQQIDYLSTYLLTGYLGRLAGCLSAVLCLHGATRFPPPPSLICKAQKTRGCGVACCLVCFLCPDEAHSSRFARDRVSHQHHHHVTIIRVILTPSTQAIGLCLFPTQYDTQTKVWCVRVCVCCDCLCVCNGSIGYQIILIIRPPPPQHFEFVPFFFLPFPPLGSHIGFGCRPENFALL